MGPPHRLPAKWEGAVATIRHGWRTRQFLLLYKDCQDTKKSLKTSSLWVRKPSREEEIFIFYQFLSNRTIALHFTGPKYWSSQASVSLIISGRGMSWPVSKTIRRLCSGGVPKKRNMGSCEEPVGKM